MPPQLGIVRGTLDLLVLKILTWGPMHGFEITSWLERRSNDRFEMEESGLYQSLYRLEERGDVTADWGITENNRRARYYTISPTGRARLRTETAAWIRYSAFVTEVLTAAKPA